MNIHNHVIDYFTESLVKEYVDLLIKNEALPVIPWEGNLTEALKYKVILALEQSTFEKIILDFIRYATRSTKLFQKVHRKATENNVQMFYPKLAYRIPEFA